jgi:putative hemolysin
VSLYDSARVERLARINLDDVLASFGWDRVRGVGRQILSWPFCVPARRFACQVLTYDHLAAESGLQAGSHRFLKSLLNDLVIAGQEYIPPEGPVLFLSNHPGMTDTVALFASIPRADLRIVAADRPFLRELPATSAQLIYVPQENSARVEVLRQVASCLRSGGAILTFPAGHIEPDPLVLSGAEASLDNWSNSIGLFARLSADAVLIPVIVSGVLAPKATFHPLTRLRRQQLDREKVGATLQILASVLWPGLWRDLWHVTVHVCFAPPIPARELAHLHDPDRITRAVIERVKPFVCQIARPAG